MNYFPSQISFPSQLLIFTFFSSFHYFYAVINFSSLRFFLFHFLYLSPFHRNQSKSTCFVAFSIFNKLFTIKLSFSSNFSPHNYPLSFPCFLPVQLFCFSSQMFFQHLFRLQQFVSLKFSIFNSCCFKFTKLTPNPNIFP